ncbi:MAG: hypothetical protein K8T10_00420 [Candidatus Eremiobacteraeota bacterium]|nr:hypothetical protein [Candidatus Eremiobacteraeota bacterium]
MRNKTGKLLSVMWIPVLLMILAVCIGCQQEAPKEEAKAPVVIESKTPEPSPTSTVEAQEPDVVISANFVPKSTKDPFVPVVRRQGEEAAPPPVVTPGDSAGVPGPPSGGTELPSGEEVPGAEETPKGPQVIGEKEAGVYVTGIMRIGGRYSAILSSEKRSYIVKSGQKLGDWVVSGITQKNVTLSGKGYKAILKLPDELKTLKSKSGGGAEGPGAARGAAPEEEKGPKLPSAPIKGEGGEEAPPPPPPPG